MTKDYYKILGISKNASKEEIKRAYRKLAHQYHPDKTNGDEKKFKEINDAYQVLSNDQKRAQYDQFGTAFEGFRGGPGFDWGGINIEDFGDFGDIFGDIFSRGRTRHRYKSKAKDIVVDLELSLEDIYKGLERNIKLRKDVKCSKCKGSGGEPGSAMKRCSTCEGSGEIHQTQRTFFGSFSRVTTCPDCQGEGEIPEKNCSKCRGRGVVKDIETVTVNIPAGVDHGQIIKLESQGEAGEKGELPGDLYIKIYLKPHKYFTKQGDDIYYELPLNFTQAVLGDKIEIPTLGKKVKLKIPAGIESGKLIRIKDKGMPMVGGTRGDQLVKIRIKTPKRISKKVRELLEKLKEEDL